MSLNLLNPGLISHLGVSEIVLTRVVSEEPVHVNSAKSPLPRSHTAKQWNDHSEILAAAKRSNDTSVHVFLSGVHMIHV